MLPLTFIQPVLSSVWSIVTSRLGSLIIVGCLAYGYGEYRTNKAWQLKNAIQEAALRQAHAEELAREANASRAIAEAAAARAEVDTAKVTSMQHEIDTLKAMEPANATGKVPTANPCTLDAVRIERLRRFDAAGH